METYNYTTHSTRIPGDMHTPVSLYLKLRDLYPQSVLMESSDYHAGENSRSFIALCPLASIAINRGTATVTLPDGAREEHTLPDRPEAVTDALRDYVIVINPFRSELRLVELRADGEASGLPALEAAIDNRNYATYAFARRGPAVSTLTDEELRANVRRGIAHCMRGDVFQIVLSRRFIQPFDGDDFPVYRALRRINPSPYLFYFDFGGYRIFGSSPETHCKIEGQRAFIDPIAGTTRRTGDAPTDRRLTEALLNDPKENAEHVMLVDLARNDLSRNCHDVRVVFYKEPQYYSHVIHLASRVEGTLNAGVDPLRAFADTFPAGTLSGAPKVRAMQLISQIEPHNRGAYGGTIGFIGLDGDMTQAITIRTFVSRNNELWYQAGCGVVSDSSDEGELQEVNNKLAALRRAIEEAEEQSAALG